MRVYLAARYSRRLELCGYRDQLRELGHDVQAVWLDGEHQISDEGKPIGEHGESLVEGTLKPGEKLSPDRMDERAVALRAKFANDDFRDVTMCEMCISFTEPPRQGGGRNRGGRHVEFGIALGMMKRVVVVGYRENIFHWHEDVRFFPTWEECLAWLRPECRSVRGDKTGEAAFRKDVR